VCSVVLIRIRYYRVDYDSCTVRVGRRSLQALFTHIAESIALRFLEERFKHGAYRRFPVHHILYPNAFVGRWLSGKEFEEYQREVRAVLDAVRQTRSVPDFVVLHCQGPAENAVPCKHCQREKCRWLLEIYEVKQSLEGRRTPLEQLLKPRQRKLLQVVDQRRIPYYVLWVDLSSATEGVFQVCVYRYSRGRWLLEAPRR